MHVARNKRKAATSCCSASVADPAIEPSTFSGSFTTPWIWRPINCRTSSSVAMELDVRTAFLDRDRIKLTDARLCEKRSPFDKLRRSNPERAAALDCFASLAMTNQ
jgi:hypothetical protein